MGLDHDQLVLVVTENGTIVLFILRFTVRVVLYVVADLIHTLTTSPFWNVEPVPTLTLFFTNHPVLIVPVTVCPVANHAIIIGLDI